MYPLCFAVVVALTPAVFKLFEGVLGLGKGNMLELGLVFGGVLVLTTACL